MANYNKYKLTVSQLDNLMICPLVDKIYCKTSMR